MLCVGDVDIYELPADLCYTALILGQGEGVADVHIAMSSELAHWAYEVVFEDLPTRLGSTAEFQFGTCGSTPATVNLDGDGAVDETISPSVDGMSLLESFGLQLQIDVKPGSYPNALNLVLS